MQSSNRVEIVLIIVFKSTKNNLINQTNLVEKGIII
jgi:hypothetical protein